MFSNKDNLVREKRFRKPRKDDDKKGLHHTDVDTLTDNHLLFLAQRERVRASIQSPVSRLRRFFSWH